MFDVIGIGELLIDFTQLSADGDGYPTMAAHPGGAIANYLAPLAKFGTKCAMVGKVGDDTFGHLLVNTMSEAGISTDALVLSPDVFTTLAFVTLSENGNRDFAFARKPGADTCLRFDEIDLSILDGARVVHFGSLSLTDEPSRDATVRFIEYAKSKGILISYDPNLRKPLWKNEESAREMLLFGMKYADVVKLSEDEGVFLFGADEKETAEIILREYGARVVYVTMGEKGCYYATEKFRGYTDGVPANAVDTTGAGDIFGGSAMWRLLSMNKSPDSLDGEDLREITSFACRIASKSTEKYGGISSVPEML